MSSTDLQESKTGKSSTKISKVDVDNLNILATEYEDTNLSKMQEAGEAALRQAESIDYQEGVAASSLILCKYAIKVADYPLAYTSVSRAYRLFTQLNDEPNQLECLIQFIIIAERTGNLDTHLETALQALRFAKKLADKKTEALLYYRLGNFHNKIDELENALKAYQNALGILERIGEKVWHARITVTYGATRAKSGKQDIDLDSVLHAIDYMQGRIDPVELAISYGLLGRICFMMGAYDRALIWYKKKLTLAEKVKNNKVRCDSLIWLGQIYLHQGQLDTALETLQLCIVTAEKIGAKLDLSKAYQHIVAVYKAQEEYQSALFYHERFVETKDRLFNEQANMHRKILMVQYETQKAQLEAQYQKKRAEDAEQRAKQDKQYFSELAKLKDEFIASATHDLKNPLTTILTSLYVIRKKSNVSLTPYLDRIERQVQRMNSLIANMLELAKLETKYAIQPSLASMYELLENLMSDFQTIASEKQINLTLHLASGLNDLTFCFDQDNMHRALSNLISNAIKYSPDGGQIQLDVRIANDKVLIDITDTGYGIPAADLPHIFKRFYRVDSDDIALIDGTGLGLSIVKSIVEQHNGLIEVESEIGHGTTFTVRLPYKTEL